uniref:Uncharacterized protein n=1 Tax=Anguilla anguilla TaxID=7936 RepID=A0A0E9RWV4_ANGAN
MTFRSTPVCLFANFFFFKTISVFLKQLVLVAVK